MNSPEEWTRVAQLLAVATKTPPDQREAWIDALEDSIEIKMDLRQMLGAWNNAGEHGFLDEPVLTRPLSDDRLGTLAGEFTLIRRLGSGGVGEVYLGFNEDSASLRKRPAQVAIKVLHRRFQHSEDVLAAFVREQALLKSLDHPGLVTVLDSGATSSGVPYIVMDYIKGQPIDVFCNKKSAGLHQRLNLFRQLCDAVAYLHECNILHLDIKPSNVLVTPAGEVKLVDLGLAKLISETEDDDLGRFVSASFSSPEQVRGKKLSVASDVYSLGAVLYLLLTGRRPLELDNLPSEDLLRAVVDRRPLRADSVLRSPQPADRTFQIPVPLHEWEKMLQGPLARLLAKMLNATPSRRPRSVSKLAAGILKTQRKQSSRYIREPRTCLHLLLSVSLFSFGTLLLVGSAREVWLAYRAVETIGSLVENQKLAGQIFTQMAAPSSAAERQRFVADQTTALQRTYGVVIPALLSSKVAPRRQIASYAVDSMALISEMAPTAMGREDLAASSAHLLQTIAKLERDDLNDDSGAQSALVSAKFFSRATGSRGIR